MPKQQIYPMMNPADAILVFKREFPQTDTCIIYDCCMAIDRELFKIEKRIRMDRLAEDMDARTKRLGEMNARIEGLLKKYGKPGEYPSIAVNKYLQNKKD